ncbi:MAG TPA: hypothetical protein VE195_03595 [Acidobacteriaceae bacterium]|nr:hypothetical protein [Acidobacteriaceae bacterium]
MPAIDPAPLKMPSRPPSAGSPKPDDGTRALLKAGFWIMLVSLLSLLLTETVFGGIGIYGARSNGGWLFLMFALMGVPFSLMLLVLGGAKWLRNRRLNRGGN